MLNKTNNDKRKRNERNENRISERVEINGKEKGE